MNKFIYPVLVLIFIRICVCLFISHRNSSILILFSIKKSREYSMKFFTSFRYTASAPAIHIHRKYYCSNNALFAIRFKMGSKTYGKTKTIQYRTNITHLQCHSSNGKFWHFRICKYNRRISHLKLKWQLWWIWRKHSNLIPGPVSAIRFFRAWNQFLVWRNRF